MLHSLHRPLSAGVAPARSPPAWLLCATRSTEIDTSGRPGIDTALSLSSLTCDDHAFYVSCTHADHFSASTTAADWISTLLNGDVKNEGSHFDIIGTTAFDLYHIITSPSNAAAISKWTLFTRALLHRRWHDIPCRAFTAGYEHVATPDGPLTLD